MENKNFYLVYINYGNKELTKLFNNLIEASKFYIEVQCNFLSEPYLEAYLTKILKEEVNR